VKNKAGKTFGDWKNIGRVMDVYQCDICSSRTIYPEDPCLECARNMQHKKLMTEVKEYHEEEAAAGII